MHPPWLSLAAMDASLLPPPPSLSRSRTLLPRISSPAMLAPPSLKLALCLSRLVPGGNSTAPSAKARAPSTKDKIAQHRYKDMEASEGKFFKLEHCWELLQTCEKWKLIDKESFLLAEENKIMSMNRDDMDDLTKTWHDMARRAILKRRMEDSAPCGGMIWQGDRS
ncbi:Lactation elevated protein 1 [Hordeum vulgare]|nr:Lactation elevated protein 1 [Hordeum vulgare]